MAEFSLGAAVGATGKFPRYKAPERQELVDDRTRDELSRLRQMVSVDDKKYHLLYQDDVKNLTTNFVKQQAELFRQRDPNIVEKSYLDKNNWNTETNKYINKSAYLEKLENLAEQGDAKGRFVPNSVLKARDLLRTSKTEQEYLAKLKENPDIFADGYVSFDGTTGVINVKADQKVDFPEYIRKELLRRDLANAESEIATTDKTGKILTRTTVFTIPANEAEARAMRDLAIKRTGNANATLEPNAYDIGYNWFANSPTAVSQYKAIKYDRGEKDAVDKSTDELYKDFYKEYIVTAIPSYEKQSNMFVGNRSINIYNTPAVTTPAGFQRAPQYTVNYGLGNIKAKSTSFLSKTGAGTKLLLPRNKYIVNMETGKSAFGETDVSQGTFYVSTVSVMPSVKLKDGTYRPLAEKEVTDISSAGNAGKIMYLPWALADEKELNISTLPAVGKSTYAIPLFEPTVKDGKSMMVIPKTARSGDRPDALSYVLGAIFREQKLNKEEAADWKKVYREIMGDVVDETEIK